MKIDINKDFEKAFPDDLWKGFTLKQIITFSVGLIRAAGTIIALWVFLKISPVTGSYIAIPVMPPDLFHRNLTNTRTIPCGRCTKRCGFTGQLKNLLMVRKSSEDRQDIYHAPSCCKKEKEKKEIIR